LSGSLVPLPLGRRDESYLEPHPHSHSGPETASSISHTHTHTHTSFRSGNWPWLPRAEIESSTLNHFLCLVTTHGGISTNPFCCHGFRPSTWGKTAWDIPAPNLICLALGWALESDNVRFPCLCFLQELRNIQVWPSVERGPAQACSITKRLFCSSGEERRFKEGSGEDPVVQYNVKGMNFRVSDLG
jgi:hypothetical protein